MMEWFGLEGAFKEMVASGRPDLFLLSAFVPSLLFQAYWAFYLFPHTQQNVSAGALERVGRMLKGTHSRCSLSSSSLVWDLAALGTVWVLQFNFENCSPWPLLPKRLLIFWGRWRAPGVPPPWVMGWGWANKKSCELVFAVFKSWRNRSKLCGTTACQTRLKEGCLETPEFSASHTCQSSPWPHSPP